ncbi:uncharacterized protein ANIA_11287 [Aspergillus nidulans FGSC A4]|uniref:Uncharacterized protein n=1 Tax=Emericella nidulans (strain FGSC A4 / ATCC 38163 / CBS 112.46 / NRRL 194 / M139) TaxID=227321 RepID=C8VTX7_EMENI|nr:hypothetical protein [Aspergillus nidulans FGSC A4]CBF88291.1 TPA: hypothetical protein ANIA_11287 [Aspergillus nidulans FGSC A4]
MPQHEMTKSDSERIQSSQAKSGGDMSLGGFASRALSAGTAGSIPSPRPLLPATRTRVPDLQADLIRPHLAVMRGREEDKIDPEAEDSW